MEERKWKSKGAGNENENSSFTERVLQKISLADFSAVFNIWGIFSSKSNGKWSIILFSCSVRKWGLWEGWAGSENWTIFVVWSQRSLMFSAQQTTSVLPGKFLPHFQPLWYLVSSYCSRLRTSRQDVNKLKEKKCSLIAIREKSIKSTDKNTSLNSFDI